MLRLLLESGANANIRGHTSQRTPIFLAGEAGDEEMVSLLIHHGAKFNLIDQYGMNASVLPYQLSTLPYSGLTKGKGNRVSSRMGWNDSSPPREKPKSRK